MINCSTKWRSKAEGTKPAARSVAARADTVKVWPADAGTCCKVGATANLDGVCARRQRAAMPERIQVRCKGSATLDNKKTTSAHGKPLSTASGTILNEAIRGLTQIDAL